jgi:hypothetical protein
MSNEASEILSQAKAQVRKEKLNNFFKQNFKLIRNLVIAALIAVLIFFVVNVFNKSRQAKFSEILHQSLIDQQIGNIAKAKENLKIIYDAKTAPNGVQSLASLRLATLLFDEGKKAEAAEIYVKINQCRSCDNYIKDLSGLLAVKSWMSDENEVKKDDLIARIEKIESKNKLLKYYILEQKAILEMLKNNLEKSYQIFELISKNSESSQVLKTRANQHLQMIIDKGFEPKIDPKSATKEAKK